MNETPKIYIQNLIQERCKNLKFINKSHEYFVDYIKFDSVTTWLSSDVKEPFDVVKVANAVRRYKNSEYYMMETKEILRLWNLTGVRGSKKHKQIEDWLLGKKTDEETKDSIWFRNHNLTPENTLSEIKVYSKKLRLAGTIDLIRVTKIKNQYLLEIFDIKTSSKIDYEKISSFAYQLYTYKYLLREILNDKDKFKIKVREVVSIKPIMKISENAGSKTLDDNFYEPRLISLDPNDILDLKDKMKKRFLKFQKDQR